jgi:hypothetical protein
VKPTFLVIGAQKCATTSLCDLIGQHPDVFMTTPKEPYFFSHEEVWARGWSWYESLFEGARGLSVAGEGSTTYTQCGLFPNAAPRVAEHLPQARLIYIVRDPLERIRSHWMHLRARGNREPDPLPVAVFKRPEYVDNSMYWRQINRYRQSFADDRILVLFFEDFQKDPRRACHRAFEFLGVDPSFEPEDPERPRHVSAERREDGTLTGVVRRIPFFTRLRDAAPVAVREPLRLVLKRGLKERPPWTEESRAWVIGQLRDDALAFLKWCGRDDLWPSVAE